MKCGRRARRRVMSLDAVKLIAQRFRTLGEPMRLRILQGLRAGEASVNDLTEALGATQPNFGRRLWILLLAGIGGRRHDGRLVRYFVADPAILDLCRPVCEGGAL